MKKLSLFMPLVAASFLASPLLAQDRSADHEALRALRQQFVDALGGTDANAIADCFAPQFAFTGSDQTLATSREEIAAYYARWFEAEDAPLARMEVRAEADTETKFTGPETGISHGTGLLTFHLAAGPVVEMPARWTATVRKVDDDWKVETAHIGVNVLENPVMTARVGFWRTVSYAAGAGGLLLGLLLARLMRSKKSA